MISYFQAIVIGLLQGVTELFPVSSLGHSVLIPKLFGWDKLVKWQSSSESPYLAFLVGLHVATALALLLYFRREWIAIIKGFFRTLGKRRIEDSDERMAWLLILGTIPVGAVGLVFEHQLRTVFAKPVAAAAFLMVNGVILLGGERLRKRAEVRALAGRRLDSLALPEGVFIGSSEILALFAGISRSGATMVAGLLRGLDHEDAARFSFLLATPVILAAGVYKLPDLIGHNGDGIRGQVLVGSIVSGIAAWVAVRFLMKFFETRTLTPFAVYCLVFGAAMLVTYGVF
jgi:undecaprenyl-diphosphatase